MILRKVIFSSFLWLRNLINLISSVFSRFMNQYFLLIACLQLWPLITPVNPASTWGPLIFIFAVSSTKEAWDDYNRYLSDKKANEKEVWLVRQGMRKLVWKLFLNPLSPFVVCFVIYISNSNKRAKLTCICWQLIKWVGLPSTSSSTL
jgi:hypothetical protein